MQIGTWVKVKVGQGTVIGEIARLEEDQFGTLSLWLTHVCGREGVVDLSDVYSIECLSVDDAEEKQRERWMNEAGEALDKLAREAVVVFDKICENLPDDYANLSEQLVESIFTRKEMQ